MGSYTYTGYAQFVTVKTTNGYPYQGFTITAYGAQGGNSSGAVGGKGEMVSGYFPLYNGEKLEIIAGGQGASTRYATGAGGGGGTFVFKVSSDGSLTPLIVAGAGGGASQFKAGGAGSYSSKNANGVRGGGGAAYPGGPYGGGGAGARYNGVTAGDVRGAHSGGGAAPICLETPPAVLQAITGLEVASAEGAGVP